MRPVVIIGVGQVPVREHWDLSIKELAGQAILAALEDSGRAEAQALYVGNMLSGRVTGQDSLGTLIADWISLLDIETAKLEAACGSGAAAVRAAIMAVASGQVESAIAVGVEKMTETPPSETTLALATASDADYELSQGISFVGLNALVMQRYLYEYGWKHQDFANFSINAHRNALGNPCARLHESVDLDDYIKARMVAPPINLLDASPIGDGAAAVVIVPQDRNVYKKHSVRIVASATSTDTLSVHSRQSPLWLSAAERSVRLAYAQAGVSPGEIDIFELHDAFSIMAALSLEACGFCDKGQGPRLALDGEIFPTGRIPIATFGGLKGRGHPVGATGVYQIVEVVKQIRGRAQKNQIDGCKIGMAQNIGGSGATIYTHILSAV
jgi:acetyl-CoA C-acetyltransferase